MPTSLASQLSKVNGQQSVLKYKHSLLFDKSKSAQVDKDVLLSIGKSGLADLISQNASFSEFQDTLFSNKHKDQDRMLLSKEENANLDVLIMKFTRLLSPFFLQSCSFKVLEWLIRHDRINELNIDALIECILPYHETKQFVQVIQAIVFPDNCRWNFLKTIQKTKVPLDRTTLVRRCAADHSIITFICDITRQSKKSDVVHRSLYTFFTCTIVEFIQSQKEMTENQIILLIPTLISFLKIVNPMYGDLQAASQICFSQLSAKTRFDTEMIHQIIEAAAKGMNKSNVGTCLLTIITICQLQELESFPTKAYQVMMAFSEITKELSIISQSYEIDKFLIAFVDALIQGYVETPNERCFAFIESIFNSGCVNNTVASVLCQKLLRLLSSESQKNVENLIILLHSKFQQEMDSTLAAILNSGKENNSMRDLVFTLSASLFKGTLSEPILESGTSLFLSLEHPNPKIRLLALQKLSSSMNDKSSKSELTMDCLQEVLLNRLRDDDSDVVQHVLNLENILEILGEEVLTTNLINVIWGSSNWKNRSLALSILVKVSSGNIQAKQTILSCAFATSQTYRLINGLRKALTENNSEYLHIIKECTFLEFDENPKEEAFFAYNKLLLGSIASDSIKKNYLNLFKDGLYSKNANIRAFSFLVLNKAIAQQKNADIKLETCGALMKAASKNQLLFSGKWGKNSLHNITDGAPSECLFKIIFKMKNSESTLIVDQYLGLFTIQNVINQLESSKASNCWFYDSDALDINLAQKITWEAYQIICRISNEDCLKFMVSSFFKEVSDFCLPFCCNVALNDESSTISKLISLKVMGSFIKALSRKKIDFQLVVPCLTVMCSNPVKAIRVASCECLREIQEASLDITENINQRKTFYGKSIENIKFLKFSLFKELVDNLVLCREEISTDENASKALLMKLCDGEKSKEDVLLFYLSHILCHPLQSAKIEILNQLSEIDSPLKIKTLFNLFDNLETAKDAKLSQKLIRCYTPVVAKSLLSSKNTKYSKGFLKLLDLPLAPSDICIQTISSALESITKEFFEVINMEYQKKIALRLFKILAVGTADMASIAKKSLMEISLSSIHLLHVLTEAKNHLSTFSEAPAKKQKGESFTNSAEIHFLSTILEVIDSKHFITNIHDIIPITFEILKIALGIESSGSLMPLEYAKQLIMSVLNSIFVSLLEKSVKVDESLIDIDSVIQSIRMTENSQTHNVAFLLLANVASIHSQLVLKSVMPIFTFMGTNVMRQDDDFSFHVIKKTVNIIVPALISQHDSESPEVKSILDIFLDALYHIPRHRRLPIFKILVERLGEEEFLGRIAMLIAAKPKSVKSEKTIGDLEFAHQLINEFGIGTQMTALLNIMISVRDCLCTNVAEATTLLHFVKQHFNGKSFATDMIALAEAERQTKHMKLIEMLVLLITKVGPELLASVYESLAIVMDILTFNEFVKSISILMKSENNHVSIKAMMMLSEKVRAIAREDDSQISLTSIIDDLCAIIASSETTISSLERKQVALGCIGDISKYMCSDKPEIFTNILQLLISEQALMHENDQVSASSMISLSFICGIGPRIIPYLPKFIPFVNEALSKSLKIKTEDNEIICMSSFILIRSIVDAIPQFVSPYVSNFIGYAISPEVFTADEKKCAEYASDVLETISAKVSPKVVLNAAFSRLQESFVSGKDTIVALLNFIGNIISNMTRSDLTSHFQELTKFFLDAFDVRIKLTEKETSEVILLAENAIIECFLKLTMKLNESFFKPLFLKMVDWATSNISFSGLSETNKIRRQLSFYHLLDSLLDRLKSLGVSYYSYLLDNTISILNSNEKFTLESTQLWKYSISTMQKYFLHDDQGLMDDKKFTKLMTPLLDQLDKTALHGENYLENMLQVLVPCVGQFAITAGSDARRKPLNKMICMKSRKESTEIRLVSIYLLKELYTRLGDQMLIFFPETIPFIAELMEDDNEDVEIACQDLCSVIQNYLGGENIQQYFNPQ